MSDQPTPPQDADEEPAKRGKKKLIIMAAVLLLVLGGGAFGFLKFFSGSAEPEEGAEAASEQPSEGDVLDIATLTSTVAGDAQLARVGLAVVTTEDALAEDVEAKFPLVKDAAVSELARSDATALRTVEGADDLRARLTKRAKKIYPDGEVVRVLLTELVVQ